MKIRVPSSYFAQAIFEQPITHSSLRMGPITPIHLLIVLEQPFDDDPPLISARNMERSKSTEDQPFNRGPKLQSTPLGISYVSQKDSSTNNPPTNQCLHQMDKTIVMMMTKIVMMILLSLDPNNPSHTSFNQDLHILFMSHQITNHLHKVIYTRIQPLKLHQTLVHLQKHPMA